ncbi:helix-turn-helix transcriptional regulator [Brevundimonas subvibrioides]|uniref:helix-turn-helix transcriptional regulator n=1 Tax=Brevundimonas subvibrioides TaxID=74313 RepID=UPI0022B3F0C0|nr:helix-turn-helix domain-containing protein [Brevundimonas subvibrioides]
MSLDNPRLLSTAEAAAQLGLSPGYLKTKRVTGGGPAFVKMGARVSYHPAALDAWIQANTRRSTSDQGGVA